MDFSQRDQETLMLLRQLGNLLYNPPSYTCVKEFVPDPILNRPPAVWTADPPYRKIQ
jgi:hypothetical protein